MIENHTANLKDEREKIIKIAWIFDVDGPITNPKEKRITEPEILDSLTQKLEINEAVVLNTGRSLTWMTDRVINPLLEKIKDKKCLQNFFASGEKGGAWITFDKNGQMQHHKDDSISTPLSLQQQVRDIIETSYRDTMFYDDTKETMISTEMKDGYSIEKYSKQQEELVIKLQNLINKSYSDRQFKVDPTTIATDIENKYVGKHFAIKRIQQWLKEKDINPQKYVAFGDSFKSDIPMAEELNSQNLPVKFVYVGSENIDASKYPFPIETTKNKFVNGTLEFLKSL